MTAPSPTSGGPDATTSVVPDSEPYGATQGGRTGRRARIAALTALATVTSGSLLATGGYAWYLRSDAYREYCARVLTESLRLPSEIGQVVPRSRSSREFRDVRIWLPQRRDEAAFCESAIVRATPTASDPNAFELELRGGQTEISTRTWLREDYRNLLESGLRPGFDPDGPRRVIFRGMDLTFEREAFRATLSGASGEVSFVNPHLGQAVVRCNEFNGHRTLRDVTLRATFSPQESGIRPDRVELTVPKLPIAIVGLDELAGLALRSGSFDGQLVYEEHDDGQRMTVRGTLYNLQLAECTAGFVTPVWRGTVPELELEELTLLDGAIARLRFRGLFTDIELGDVLTPWGLGGVGGHVDLYVNAAELTEEGIVRLAAAGMCEDAALDEISAAVGWGRLTGRAKVVIDDLTITHNHLASANATIEAIPPADEAGTLERALVASVLDRAGGISLPDTIWQLLPEQFEYATLGVIFEARDERLNVFGTHGPQEKTILSVRLHEHDWPVLMEPGEPIDLRPALSAVREQLQTHFAQRWRSLTPRDAWQAISIPLQHKMAQPRSTRGGPEPE